MAKKNQGDVNEVWLFHGTGVTKPEYQSNSLSRNTKAIVFHVAFLVSFFLPSIQWKELNTKYLMWNDGEVDWKL